MDYIYGELNTLATKQQYTGGTTDSAEVYVNQSTGEITVVAHLSTTDLIQQIEQRFALRNVPGETAGTGEIISQVSQQNGYVQVVKRYLTPNDIPNINQTQVNGLITALASKQDNLYFQGTYDPSTNKVATRQYVDDQVVSGVEGATHFLGFTTTDPSTGVVTIDGVVITPKWGDEVVTIDTKKEYVYKNNTWNLKRDENPYAVKGSIVNADIANNAAIAQSKVVGLTEIDRQVAILIDDTNPQSVKGKIDAAIALLDSADTPEEHKFLTAVTETNGIITVTRAALVKEDIPVIEQTQVNGLVGILSDLQDDITAMALNEIVCGEGEILWKISQNRGKVSVTKRTLTANDIPTLSYEKISGLATVAHTGSYTDLLSKPTITYDGTNHCLVFNGI